MKLLFGAITLALALTISCVAAYFSVVGLAAIFPASALAVVIMGCALEAGKLVTAGWLHSNWSNPKASKLHKGYMLAATCALMVITALGIYGFLAKGHLEQQTPLAPVELQIAQKQARIDQINVDVKRLTDQQNQIAGAVNAEISKDAAKGLRARGHLDGESKEIQSKIDADNTEMNKLSSDLVPLKLQVNEVETKLGPLKYLGDLFGLKDTEGAVRIVILLLMFAFDPLAVVLVISSGISIGDGLEDRRKKEAEATVLPRTPLIVPMPHKPLGEGMVDAIASDFGGTEEPVVEAVAEPEPEPVVEEVVAEPEPAPEPVVEPEPAPEPVIDAEAEPETNLLVELEPALNAPAEEEVAPEPEEAPAVVDDDMSDKERLLDILERKPQLLQSIVDAIRDEEKPVEAEPEPAPLPHVTDSWLGTGPAK